jgi:hypothetical protein
MKLPGRMAKYLKISDSTRVTYFQMGRASFDTIDF